MRCNGQTIDEILARLTARPAQRSPAVSPAVAAIRRLDRPARARGLTQTSITQFNVDMTALPLLAPNQARRFFCVIPIAASVIIAPVGFPVSSVDGFTIPVSGVPVLFTEDDWGAFIQQGWNVVGTFGPGVGGRVCEEVYLT